MWYNDIEVWNLTMRYWYYNMWKIIKCKQSVDNVSLLNEVYLGVMAPENQI